MGGGGARPWGTPRLFRCTAFRGFRKTERPGHFAAPSARRGFALVELIAVACAIALVSALGIYWIKQARIRARTLGCRDNLRQIGAALAQYTDTSRMLPSVTLSGEGYRLAQSPLALLVPYLPLPGRGEATYDSAQPWFRHQSGVAAVVVPTFRCPASTHRDPLESIAAQRTQCPLGTLLAATDYVVCKGPNDSWCLDHGVSEVPLKERGAFEIGRPLGPDQFADGLAQTIVVGEGSGGQLSLKDRFPLTLIDRATMQPFAARNYWCWPFLNTSQDQLRTQVAAAGIFGTTAVDLNRQPTIETILNTEKLDDCRPRYKDGFHSVSNFRSQHPGGAYFLFADGASHFVSDGIVPDVYRALSSIAGSESVSYIN